jgi:hypothetical protein
MTVPKRLLLADVESSCADEIRITLRNLLRNISITDARNANEAAVLVHVREYDLVVLCCGPDVSGALRLLNAIHDQGSQMPVIAIVPTETGASTTELRQTGALVVESVPDDKVLTRTIRTALKSRVDMTQLRRVRLTRSREESINIVRVTAGTLYHEISNPIMTILGMSELLLAEEDMLDEEIRSKLNAIRSSAERIQSTLNRLIGLEEPHLRDTVSGHIIDHKSTADGPDSDN